MHYLRKGFTGGLLALFGLGLALIAVEVGFRLMAFRSVRHEAWNDRPPFYYQHERSPTLQDFPYDKSKPPGVFRIGVIGDSYSFAPFMQFTDAFPKRLEHLLNMNDSDLRGEVINYGVPGYSTSHEIAAVRQALDEGADLIILQITLNDAELKPYRPIGIREFGRFGPYQPSPRWESIFRWWRSGRFVAERLHNEKTAREYERYFIDLFEEPKTWEPFSAAVRKINRMCQRRNIPLVGVVFPLFGLPLDDSYPFHGIHAKVGGLLSEIGVPFLDLFEIFRGAPLDRIQVIPGGDRHPNEIAHRLSAEHIYLWLEKQQRLPPQLIIKKRFRQRTKIVDEEPWEPEKIDF